MRALRRWKSEWLWLAALTLLVSLHFWFPRIGSGPLHDTYSTAAAGKKAFYLLVREWGRDHYLSVRRNSEPLSRLTTYGPPGNEADHLLCLLGPARYPTAEEWDHLLDWVYAGGSLVVAARYDDADFSIDRLDIEVKSLPEGMTGPSELKTLILDDLFRSASRRDNLHWESKGEIRAADAEPLVWHGDAMQAVAKRHGAGRVVVVASDYVFSNESLAWGDNTNSILALRLLEAAGFYETIYFDESLNVSGTPKVVALLLAPFLRPVTVQLLIGLLIFGWWQSRRFGPLLPRAVPSRHNIVDHTDAVGILYYKSGDGSGALRSYLRQLIAELRLKTFKGQEDRVLEPLARRLGTNPVSLKKTLRRASKAARTPRLPRKTAAESIRRLAAVRQAAARRSNAPSNSSAGC